LNLVALQENRGIRPARIGPVMRSQLFIRQSSQFAVIGWVLRANNPLFIGLSAWVSTIVDFFQLFSGQVRVDLRR
jgi:hypothetical protein